MRQLTRRRFLAASAAGLAGAGGAAAARPDGKDVVRFFLTGDTHYLADRARPGELTDPSRRTTARLIDWLNRLPGTAIPAEAGGGRVGSPRGVIHAGDLIDSGDKRGADYRRMQETELAAYLADYGLTGRDGRLRHPVYEVHGNHDGPQGDGPVPAAIRARNRGRPGLVNVSANGLHYSWDWGGVHFLCLGIVVGAAPGAARRRRYAPHDSYAFLRSDLARHVGRSGRPVVLTHHVDVARYSGPCDPGGPAGGPEWDPCDVRGYYQALADYNVVGILHGHTHVRRIFRWDGTPRPARDGVPVFNTARASHFASDAQALLYFEVGPRELAVREFGTADRWQTGRWTPRVWRFPIRRG